MKVPLKENYGASHIHLIEVIVDKCLEHIDIHRKSRNLNKFILFTLEGSRLYHLHSFLHRLFSALLNISFPSRNLAIMDIECFDKMEINHIKASIGRRSKMRGPLHT